MNKLVFFGGNRVTIIPAVVVMVLVVPVVSDSVDMDYVVTGMELDSVLVGPFSSSEIIFTKSCQNV